MSEVTLQAIEKLLDHKLEPINTKLLAIEETVSNHTTLLDGITKDVKTLIDEKIITTSRLDRLEDWGQKAGKKLEIKLEV